MLQCACAPPEFELVFELARLAKFTPASNCLKRVCNGECEKQPNGSYSFCVLCNDGTLFAGLATFYSS